MQILKIFMRVIPGYFVVVYCFMHSSHSFATAFNFPSGPNIPSPIPFRMFNSTDSLNVNSGDMTSSSGIYTVESDNTTGNITIFPGATVSNTGTGIALQIYAVGGYNVNLVNNGTITASSGAAVNLVLQGGPTVASNTGIINGPFDVTYQFGAQNANLYMDGTSAQVNGAIIGSGHLNLYFGHTTAVDYIPNGAISDLTNLFVERGTLTANSAITGITTAFTTSSGTTTNLNSSVTGAAATTNNGTIFIGSAGSLGTAGIFTNNNKLNIASAFTTSTYSSFVNTSGALYVIGSGSITGNLTAGTSLNIGQDSTGVANNCIFTTGGTIAGIPIIHVYNGSVINSSLTVNHAISGVNTSFITDFGTTTTLNTTLSGTGAVANSGSINIAAANALNTSGALSNPGTITMTSSWTPNIGVNIFTNSGILNVNGGTFTKPTNFTYSGTVNLNGSGALSGALTGNGTSSQLNIGLVTSNTFLTSSAISLVPIIRVYQGSFTANHAVSGVNTLFFVDVGASATFNAAISGTGTINNSGTMVLGAISSLSGFTGLTGGLVNSSELNVIGATANAVAITNNANMSIAANVSGVGTITNASGANLTLSSGAVSNAITNAGTFLVTGASSISSLNNTGITTITAALTNSGSITNSGSMSIAANIPGAGTITNDITKTLTLSSGTVSNAITNNGIFDVTGTATTSSIDNTGTTTVTGALTNSGNISNSGNMVFNANVINGGSFTTSNNFTLAANLSMAGQTFTGSGSTTISGQRTITAANYNHSGTQYFTITNLSVYDQLDCTGCAINLAGGTVNISSNYVSTAGATETFTILTGASLVAPTTVVAPNSSLLRTISVSTVSPSIILTMTSASFVSLADPGINKQIAAVLDAMSLGTLNAQQQSLINAFNSLTTVDEYNAALHSLIPNFNSVDANIVFQNDSFKKIEQRVAALRDGNPYASKETYVAGDLDSCRAMWLSAFGGATKQLSISENDGYKARSAGVLIGFDNKIGSDHLFGLAVGMSGSTIDEYSNTGFYTDVFRYHALIYGSHNTKGSSFFDWVLSGSNNNNRGIRPIFISGTDFSASSDYNSTLFSGKMTFSTSFDCGCTTRFTPLTSVQFTNINQPAYDESGGAAALHVDAQDQSIFTIGVGGRINFPIHEWPIIPMQELRFLVSYDAIAGSNDTTANFVAGSDSFTVSNPPSKLALSLGAGLTFEIKEDLQFQANYDLQLRKRFIDQVAMLKIRYFL